jgi:hypothetical protein
MRALAVALAGIALLVSACGGSPAARSGNDQKVSLALKVSACMRAHGFPTYPDPVNGDASSQGSGTRFHGTGIDTKSPRFQTREVACEKQSRADLGLS